MRGTPAREVTVDPCPRRPETVGDSAVPHTCLCLGFHIHVCPDATISPSLRAGKSLLDLGPSFSGSSLCPAGGPVSPDFPHVPAALLSSPAQSTAARNRDDATEARRRLTEAAYPTLPQRALLTEIPLLAYPLALSRRKSGGVSLPPISVCRCRVSTDWPGRARYLRGRHLGESMARSIGLRPSRPTAYGHQPRAQTHVKHHWASRDTACTMANPPSITLDEQPCRRCAVQSWPVAYALLNPPTPSTPHSPPI